MLTARWGAARNSASAPSRLFGLLPCAAGRTTRCRAEAVAAIVGAQARAHVADAGGVGDVAVGGGYRTIDFGEAGPTILSSATFSGTDWTIEGRGADVIVGSLVAQAICADVSR